MSSQVSVNPPQPSLPKETLIRNIDMYTLLKYLKYMTVHLHTKNETYYALL